MDYLKIGGASRRMSENEAGFDYFYAGQEEMYAYFTIPKALITDDYYKKVSCEAKLLYGIMLNRMSLSRKNGWVDGEGHVFIIYTLDDVCETMNCCVATGVKIMSELDDKNGIGLIKRIKHGQGKPTQIYVMNFAARMKSDKIQTSKNYKSRLIENESQDLQTSEVRTSNNCNSRLQNNRSQDFQNSESNYNDFSYPDSSDPDISHISQEDTGNEDPTDTTDDTERETVERTVKGNIDYETLMYDYAGKSEKELVDEIVCVITDTLLLRKEKLRIAKADVPYSDVKKRLLSLNRGHIEYVMQRMESGTGEIRNIYAYLLTSLYNAPVTMSSYYDARVRHDMDMRAMQAKNGAVTRNSFNNFLQRDYNFDELERELTHKERDEEEHEKNNRSNNADCSSGHDDRMPKYSTQGDIY